MPEGGLRRRAGASIYRWVVGTLLQKGRRRPVARQGPDAGPGGTRPPSSADEGEEEDPPGSTTSPEDSATEPPRSFSLDEDPPPGGAAPPTAAIVHRSASPSRPISLSMGRDRRRSWGAGPVPPPEARKWSSVGVLYGRELASVRARVHARLLGLLRARRGGRTPSRGGAWGGPRPRGPIAPAPETPSSGGGAQGPTPPSSSPARCCPGLVFVRRRVATILKQR